MKFLKILTENIHLKIIALILGIFIWINAATDEISLYRLNFEVKYIIPNPGDSLVILTDLPQKISVTVKTTGKSYLKSRFSKKVIYKNVEKLSHGGNSITFSQEDIPLSLRENEIISIVPEKITIDVDKIESRKIPIFPGDIQTASEFIEVTGWQVYPDSVIVKGPATLIKKLQRIYTQPVKVKDITDTLLETSLMELPEKFFKVDSAYRKITLKLTLDSLSNFTLELKTKYKDKTVKITGLKKRDLELSPKDFKVLYEPLDSAAELKFIKIKVVSNKKVKISSVEPEIIAIP